MAAFIDEDEFEEIPDEEKLAIASHFLLSSPPGQIREVLSDVKVVCPEQLLSSSVLGGVFRTYNTSNQEVIKADNNEKIIVSNFSEVDPNHYVNPTTKTVYLVDHVSGEAEEDNSVPYSAGKFEKERAAIEKTLNEYVENQYCDGTTICAVLEKDGKVAVQITGQKLNLRNFWSGRWKSLWIFDPSTKSIAGEVHVLVHYFEDGNVQMVTDKTIDSMQLKYKNATDLATQVSDFIFDQETKIQDALEEMYLNMAQETFKDMRRILPVSKTKMDWSGVQMKLATSFGTGKKR